MVVWPIPVVGFTTTCLCVDRVCRSDVGIVLHIERMWPVEYDFVHKNNNRLIVSVYHVIQSLPRQGIFMAEVLFCQHSFVTCTLTIFVVTQLCAAKQKHTNNEYCCCVCS